MSACVSSLHSAAQQVSTHSYSPHSYSEQEIAIYEHEDEETRRVLGAELENQRQQVQQLDRQLEVMQLQMERVIALAAADVAAKFPGQHAEMIYATETTLFSSEDAGTTWAAAEDAETTWATAENADMTWVAADSAVDPETTPASEIIPSAESVMRLADEPIIVMQMSSQSEICRENEQCSIQQR